MSVELTYLAYTIALFFVVVFVQAFTAIQNNGASRWLTIATISNRRP
jgi:cell division protein FtsW (lipid II flippase)